MLLSLYFHNPILPPKTLKNPSFSSPLPSISSHPSKPSKTLIHCSTTPLPRSQIQRQTRLTNPKQSLPTSPIQRIAEKLRSLGIVEEKDKTQNPVNGNGTETESAGEIFIPLPTRIPKQRVGHTIDTTWSSPENPVPQPGSGGVIVRYNEMRSEVRRQKREEEEKKKVRKEVVPSLAELKLPRKELRRLITLGIELKQKKIKVGKAGITEGIVNGIHERWRNSEVVKIVCEDLCKMNMKRTHDLLEMKTGGLVVWRSGSKIILYRGADYKYPYFLADQSSMDDASFPDASPSNVPESAEDDKVNASFSDMDTTQPSVTSPTDKSAQPRLIHGVGSPDKLRFQLPGEAALVEEADRLLEGLGPRFTDWWGYDPQPIDADLLPAIVPGYRRPFRLLPYGVLPKLTNDEMTTLRRLGRPLPCHFALSRNRKLQGLAAAIVKLWEKCEIAKIAVKRGKQNTNSELMAEELKWLTGGTLLARDREFITLYRGKDFLPPAVSSAIEERRKQGIFSLKQRIEFNRSSAAAEERKFGNIPHDTEDSIVSESNEKLKSVNDQKSTLTLEQKKLKFAEAAIKRTSVKLSMAMEKKAKAEELLVELEKNEIRQEPDTDKEGITEEERHMLRKVGLRMKAFLLTGRRGIFDGTVENMHLHWKYRELVKIISKQKSFEAAYQEAQLLEAESGGILVAVERVSKGYAIIVYRGKNYERPSCLRPKTLLTKKQALKRHLETQRRESLKLHVLELAKNIDKLKHQLVKDEDAKAKQLLDPSVLPLINEDKSDIETRSDTSIGELESEDIETARSDASIGELEYVDIETARSDVSNDELGSDPSYHSINTVSEGDVDVGDPVDLSSTHHEKEASEYESVSLSESVSMEVQASKIMQSHDEGGPHADSFAQEEKSFSAVYADHGSSSNKPSVSAAKSAGERPRSVQLAMDNRPSELPSRPPILSNRDRLLLRKQALLMKRRPVLAVGKGNIVTGVATTIKSHFKKYPLAIVSVKGRAKGTSVQEVISKLQEATGAVLVSQEPTKVILYRGWGADADPGKINTRKKKGRVFPNRAIAAPPPPPGVSAELLAAIKLECGLQNNQDQNTVS